MATLPDAADFGSQRPSLRVPGEIVQDRSAQITARAAEDFAGTLGNAAFRTMDVMERKAKREADDADRIATAQARSAFLIGASKAADDAEKDQDWQTAPQRYAERLQGLQESALNTVKDAKSRALLQSQLAVDQQNMVSRIQAGADRMRVASEVASTDDVVSSLREAAIVTKNDTDMETMLTQAGDLIRENQAKGNYGPDGARIAEQKIRNLGTDFAEGRLSMLSAEKQIALLKTADSNYTRFIPADKRQAYLDRAQREHDANVRQALTLQRQELSDQLSNVRAAAEGGVAALGEKDVPSLKALQAVFGERPGKLRYDVAMGQVHAAADVRKFHDMSDAEIIQTEQSYRPTTVEMADDAKPALAIVRAGADGIIKARAQDPAGYLVATAPASQKAWVAFQNAKPEGLDAARENYLSAIKADSERIGLVQTSPLPNAYANSIAQAISQQKDENLVNYVAAEAAKWGPHWPDVQAQLAKDVPDLAMVVGAGVPRDAALTVASTSRMKKQELEELLPAGTTMKQVKDGVESRFHDFSSSFPASESAQRAPMAVRDAAVRYVIASMASGDSLESSIDKAYRNLATHDTTVQTLRGHPVRIPANLNPDMVTTGAEVALRNFEVSDQEIAMPPQSANSQFPMETYKARAKDEIRNRGYFVTSADGKGLRLYLNGAPYGKAGDKGATFTWEQLQAMGADEHATRSIAIDNQRFQSQGDIGAR